MVVTLKNGIVTECVFSLTDEDDMDWADDYSWQEKKKVRDQYGTAREKMVREQLLSRDIGDKRTLSAMLEVPRHCFVDEAMRARSCGDFPLPIGAGQTISQPYIVACMTQALRLKGEEKVLEIGTDQGIRPQCFPGSVERCTP